VGSLLAPGRLHVESAGLVHLLAPSPAGEVGERARGVSVGARSPLESLLRSGLGALAGDGIGDDVLVDDLGLPSVTTSSTQPHDELWSGLELVQARVSRARTVCRVRASFPRLSDAPTDLTAGTRCGESVTLPKLAVSYAEVGLAVEKSAFKPAVGAMRKTARKGDHAASSVFRPRFHAEKEK